MKLIEREYLNELIDVIGTPDIKVITGIRRCGKSELLNAFSDYIINNIKDANIISINFNLLEFEYLRDYKSLYDYIQKNYMSGYKNFLLIDEIQRCLGFEETINSLHASGKYDIYITGSNAFLQSSDLATLFTGRTYEISIYPFSFKEFVKYYEYKDIEEAFDMYFQIGGMAGSYLYQTQQQKQKYLLNIYETLIIRDIIERNKIRGNEFEKRGKWILDSINDFLMDGIGNITNSNSITNQFKANGINIDHNTIKTYLSYLCEAFLYKKVKRFDIQGKQYLARQDKYYLMDHGFRNAKLGEKNLNYGRVYENIVAIELLRRGYEIYIGVLYDKEIDFVAMKQNEKLYIQVSGNIEEKSTFDREVTSLLKIHDAYPKILIARTKSPFHTYEGIQIYNIANRLLQ